jgi:hypothetical protein
MGHKRLGLLEGPPGGGLVDERQGVVIARLTIVLQVGEELAPASSQWSFPNSSRATRALSRALVR